MVDLAGRRHRVGTIAARHSDRVDVVPMVLVTPHSGFAALVAFLEIFMGFLNSVKFKWGDSEGNKRSLLKGYPALISLDLVL